MLPEGWMETQLSSVAEITMGQSPPSHLCNSDGQGYPFYQGNADFGHLYPTPQVWIEDRFKVAQRGDILISVRAPVGELNIAAHECVIGRGLSAISSDKANKRFLFYLMMTKKRNLDTLGQGSTFEAINGSDLRKLSISLPPLSEQKKIAAILSSVDDAIQATQAVIDQTRKVKKGLLQQLLTRGIGHTKFKQTEIGEIPESWEFTTLGKICVEGLQTGPFGSQLHAHEYTEQGIPVVMPKDLRNGFILEQEAARVPEEKAKNLKKHWLQTGDIVFGRRGDIGRCALVREKDIGFICGTGCLRARPTTNNINSEYLLEYLQSPPVIKWLMEHATGQTMLNLNTTVLSKVPVALPSSSEQHKIKELLQSMENTTTDNISLAQQLQKTKQGLLQDLLTGKVRVTP